MRRSKREITGTDRGAEGLFAPRSRDEQRKEAIERLRVAIDEAQLAARALSHLTIRYGGETRAITQVVSALDHTERRFTELLTVDEFVAVSKVSASSRKTREDTTQDDSKATR